MRRVLLLAVAALLLAAGVAGAATLYLRKVVSADPAGLTLGDLVQVAGELPPAAQELLARSAAVPDARLLLVPAAFFRDLLAGSLGEGAALVGSRSLVAPRALVGEESLALLERLVDWMDAQGGIGRGAVELEILQAPESTALPAASPGFTLVRAERTSGLFSGVVEVTFAGAGGRTARVVLRARQAIPSAIDGVKAGETVQVVFRRGTVTIEMEGRALSSAAVGREVSVWVAESRRSFAGTAADRKVVDVVLP
ncbi:MAG TPA: flagella basal body P-ring formation protein FlgA [Desulfobacterales bacterium]|nr:flagella basal body P-ring formation protein FlgA [Desulfobacterales bacterium]